VSPAAPKPVTAAQENRFIALVIAGCSYAEASRAVEFGPRTGDRVAQRRNAEIRAGRAGTASDKDAALRECMRGLLESDNPEVRYAAEKVRGTYREAFEELEKDDPFSTPLASGVFRFPHPDYDRDPE
jgi:hypothetical protein